MSLTVSSPQNPRTLHQRGRQATEQKPLLWVLEDTTEVIETFQMLLNPCYELHIFSTLADFRRAWLAPCMQPPALFIADLLLPDGSFLDIIESQDWQSRPLAPLLVTSGCIDIEPMRQCLTQGAIDYIVKPFVGSELMIKIERGLSTATKASDLRELNPIRIDQLTRCVTHAQKVSQPLTSREMQIMSLLQQSQQEPINRADIIKKVWGATKVTNKCLDVHLSHLRSKMLEIGLEIRLHGGSAYQLIEKQSGKRS